MSKPPLLAYVEPHLPAATPAARLALAREHHLALELADDGALETEPYLRAGLPISSLQAYRLRQDPPTHRDRHRRREAARHLGQTLERAARLAVPRVITVCAHGEEIADRPFERALDFYAAFERRARDGGVRLLLEAVSPLKAAALTDPAEIARLVEILGAPEAFGLVLDTGHLADGSDPGSDLDAFFRAWGRPLEELQLRGPGDAPPRPDLPLPRWLAALPGPPAVVAVEHPQPIAEAAFRELLEALRAHGLE